MRLKVASVLQAIVLIAFAAVGLAHAGQTPRTQPITDAWITMKIHADYINENTLDGSDIDVDTDKGVVTLSGTVATEAGRARAMAIAKGTDGVKGVNDKLRIAPEAGARGETARGADRDRPNVARTVGRRVNDGWIKSKIWAQYLTENSLNDSDLDIDIAKGMVTLNGTVRSEAGRTRAVAIAKGTDGVKGVKDALKVVK